MVKAGRAIFGWGATLGSESRTEYLAALRAADAGDFARLIRFVRL
jgi:hypothetical protein